MRIGVIRRSHDFPQQQRRRASSAINTLDFNTGSPRSSLLNAINRRASAAITEGGGGGGGLIEDSLFTGGGGRAVSLGGCSSRVRHDGYHQFGRSSSQDSTGAGSGHDSDASPSTASASRSPTPRGESMDLDTDDLCYGKVLSVLGIILGVLLLTLAFATAVRYIYR